MTTLTPQDLKTLEQTRQRLSLLTTSLASLKHQLESSSPLPQPSTLSLSPQIIAQHLQSLTTHLNTNAPLLSSLIVYPLPTFPGRDREREGELNQLLRTKLDPGVEERVGGAREIGREGEGEGWRGLWGWAGVAANEMARGVEWGGEGEGEGEGEEEGKEEGEGKEEEVVGVGDVLRVLVRGVEGGR